MWSLIHRDRLLTALATTGFALAKDHSHFAATPIIDFVPAILQKAHDTVMTFAKDMKFRAGEYLDQLLGQEIGQRRRNKMQVRPWTSDELTAWKKRLSTNRHDNDDHTLVIEQIQ